MNTITEKTINDVTLQKMFCLRDVRTHKVLNVSFTEDGLKWTLDHNGNLIYFKSGRIAQRYDKNYNIIGLYFKGNLTPSSRVYVEEFIPKNHSLPYSQTAEYQGIHRSYKMNYIIAESVS